MSLFFCDPIGSSSRAADFFARGGFFGTVCTRKLVNLAFRLFLCNSVALLDLANELIALPADHLKVITGQLAPLLLDLSQRLLPLSFNLLPVHGNLLIGLSVVGKHGAH